MILSILFYKEVRQNNDLSRIYVSPTHWPFDTLVDYQYRSMFHLKGIEWLSSLLISIFQLIVALKNVSSEFHLTLSFQQINSAIRIVIILGFSRSPFITLPSSLDSIRDRSIIWNSGNWHLCIILLKIWKAIVYIGEKITIHNQITSL